MYIILCTLYIVKLYCNAIGPASDDNELEERLYEVLCACIVLLYVIMSVVCSIVYNILCSIVCNTVCYIVCNSVCSILCNTVCSIVCNTVLFYCV